MLFTNRHGKMDFLTANNFFDQQLLINNNYKGMDTEIIMQFLLAALWGGIVGLEREYRSKSAGFRTMIMISTGACFFTIMSKAIGEPGNPDRIASNIVTGIGFLGAGVIFRGGENRVSGITTAATIWTVAAVGMGIGAGYYFAAACASMLIIFVLAVLPYAENQIDKISQTRTYIIQTNYREGIVPYYEALLTEHKLRFKRTNLVKQGGIIIITLDVQGSAKNQDSFCIEVSKDELVQKFEY
jgi:putative Mg2+ transporter-C (MgtC) family protein